MKVSDIKEAIEECLNNGEIKLDQEIQFALPIVIQKAIELERRKK